MRYTLSFFGAIIMSLLFIACTNKPAKPNAGNTTESQVLVVIPQPKELTFLKRIMERHKGQKIVFNCWNPKSHDCLESNSRIRTYLHKELGERDDVAFVNIALASDNDAAWLNYKDTLLGEHITLGKKEYQTILSSFAQEQPSSLSLDESLVAITDQDGNEYWHLSGEINQFDCWDMQDKLAVMSCDHQNVCPSALAGTKWEQISPVYDSGKRTIEFKRNVYLKTRYGDNPYTFSYSYTISPRSKRGKGFMKSKRGKGCFINYYNDKHDDTDYFIIVSMTSKKLVLFHSVIPGTLDGRNWMGVYKRIK